MRLTIEVLANLAQAEAAVRRFEAQQAGVLSRVQRPTGFSGAAGDTAARESAEKAAQRLTSLRAQQEGSINRAFAQGNINAQERVRLLRQVVGESQRAFTELNRIAGLPARSIGPDRGFLRREQARQAAIYDPQQAPADRRVQAQTKGINKAADQTSELAANDDYIEALVRLSEARKRITAILNEQLALEDEFIEASARLAIARRDQAATVQTQLAVDDGYIEATALLAEYRARESAGVNARLAADAEAVGALAEERVAKARLNAATQQQIVASETLSREQAEAVVAQQDATLAIRRQANAIRNEGQGGVLGLLGRGRNRTTPSVGQQVQGALFGRNPLEFGTVPELFGQKLITSAGYAFSGAVLFGGIQAVSTLVRESTELQKELAIIRSEFQGISEETAGISFKEVRDGILDAAQAAGTALDVTANVSRQLAGAFADENTGLPDFKRGIAEAQAGLQFSKISGLPTQEITDSSTAIALSLKNVDEAGNQVDLSFKDIYDTALQLEKQYGVLSTQTIQFTADLAPLGSQLGFTYDQLASLGAVAQQVSGRSGSALAEQIGRILPNIQGNATQILDLFGQLNDPDLLQGLNEAFATNDVPEVLANMVRGYQDLNKEQRNTLLTLVGDQRQAATFAALLERAPLTLRALTKPVDGEGAFDQRWDQYRKTLQYAFDQMRVALTRFGVSLLSSGVLDGLRELVELITGLVNIGGHVLSVFQALNDATGGWAGRLFLLVGTMKLVIAGLEQIRALRAAVAATEIGSAYLGAKGGAGGAGSLVGGGLLNAPAAFGLRALQGSSPRVSGLIGRVGGIGAGGSTSFAGSGLVSFGLVAGAGLLAIKANQMYGEMAEELNKEQTDAVKLVRDKIASGQNPDDIIKRLPSFARGIHSRGGLFGIIDDVEQWFTGTNYSAPLKELLAQRSSTTADQVQEILDRRDQLTFEVLGRDQSLGDALKRNPEVKGGGDAANRDIVKRIGIPKELYHSDQLDSIVQRLRDNPDDTGLQQRYKDFIDKLREQNPSIDRFFKDMEARTAAQNAALAQIDDLLNDPANQALVATLAQAQSLYESGTISLGGLSSKIQEQIANLQTQIDIKKAGGLPYVAELVQQEEFRKKLRDLADSETQQSADILERLAGISGRDNPHAKVQRGLVLLRNLKDPGKRLEAAFSILEAQQQAQQDWVDSAANENEKLARSQQRFTLNLEAMRVIVASELRLGPEAERVQRLADEIGIAYDTMAELIAAKIVGDREAYDKIMSETPIDIDIGEGFVGNNANQQYEYLKKQKEKEADKKTDQAAKDSSVQAPTTGGVDPDDAKQKADEERQRIIDENNARDELARAYARGDAIRIARINIAAAHRHIREADNTADRIRAQAELVNAENELSEAVSKIADAQDDLGKALAGDNARKIAAISIAQARRHVREARNQEERLRARVELVNALREQRDAISAVFDAHQELLIAVAEAAGKTVRVAELQLAQSRRLLQRAIKQGAGKEVTDPLRAEIVRDVANLRSAKLENRIGDIDFALEFEKITAAQAIQQFEALLRIPNLTKEQTRELMRKIKSLRDELGRDNQFNLPDFNFDSLVYESRRLSQTTASGSTYQDNRNINVAVYPKTDADPGQIAAATATAVDQATGDPSLSGTVEKRY